VARFGLSLFTSSLRRVRGEEPMVLARIGLWESPFPCVFCDCTVLGSSEVNFGR
jgi:hypothetical protein